MCKILDEVQTALDLFMKMKAGVCEHHGGPHDLTAMLHFKFKHLNGYCGAVLAGGHPLETIPMAWQHIIQDGQPEFMLVMTEGYASATPIENYKRGSMEEDFKNNPNTEVFEIINVHGIDIKTGQQADAVVKFHYEDGVPTFDEVQSNMCEGQALEANIPRLFRMCREATLLTYASL